MGSEMCIRDSEKPHTRRMVPKTVRSSRRRFHIHIHIHTLMHLHTPLLVPNNGRKRRFYSPAQAKPHTRGPVPNTVRTSRRRDPARATSTSTDRCESARYPPHLKDPRHTFTLTLTRTLAVTPTPTFTFRACSPLLIPNACRKCRFYWPAQAKPHTRGVIPPPVRTSRRRDHGPRAGATSTSTDRRESEKNYAHLEDLDEL